MALEFTVRLNKNEFDRFEKYLDDYYTVHHARYPIALETARMKVRQAMVKAREAAGDE